MSDLEEAVTGFRIDGAAVLRGVLSPFWIETLRRGVECNIREPGPYRRGYTKPGAPGNFFGDYCNWARIGEYRQFLFNSPLPALAATLMGSAKVNLFHEHVLVKEPGTLDRTPWHHDQPYYCVDGRDTCSFWVPLDPVARESGVEFVAASHAWGRWFTPTKFVGAQFERHEPGYQTMPVIDDDRESYRFLSWDMEPGDCIAFHFLTVHGAPGNASPTTRRRAFAARFTGDDAVYVQRAGEMSPPFPEVTLEPGQPLDSETFPVVYRL